MRKTIFIGISVLLLSLPAIAQNRAKVFDNFDTTGRIKIVSSTESLMVVPKVPPAVSKPAKESEKAKSSQANPAVQKIKYTSSSRITMSSSTTMRGFTTGDLVVDSYIVESSKRYSIDPLLIYAQMHQESGFKKKARSNKGASGLMQLMPATARRFGVTDIYHPKQNIDAGVKYMRWLLDKFGGDVVLALAGYNAGEGAVMKYGYRVPPYRETQEYVRRITFRYSDILNPGFQKTAKPISNKDLVKIEQKQTVPLTTYEINVAAVRLPDGKVRLVSQ